MLTGKEEIAWLAQGGESTMESYSAGLPVDHIKLLKEAHPYFLLDNKLFVHAGIDRQRKIEHQDLDIFLWDRSLTVTALDFYKKKINVNLTEYDEVYVGHTPIAFSEPLFSCGVWMMDTGAGWSGVLSMMEVFTKEVFASDNVPAIYPGVKGRQPKN
jgi:serine/threonine protein phosphatase 1